MPVPIDIHRLRHIKNRPGLGVAVSWADFKGAVDTIGGVLMQSGLVHALLFGLKKDELPALALLDAIIDWLKNDVKCPVRTQAAAIGAVATPGIPAGAAQFAVGLIGMPSVSDAMAIQAEVWRYLAQAKKIADAFKGGDGS